ncbi:MULTISPECIES: MarR family winged helix-turn-helix transcriptional regulator [unclassified Polaromonas]|jgi:DNA-binding MarR family transcriptional regulator|uniref:MarR family winged helix-turn-helix transcriptional regulator n=1 Tax=unclassified Polaromonas TaxID=2638319 RepID=UPI000BD9CCC8|nr:MULTISPECIES: MarR family winged helix-turn-helix transcriptional regulator [unclassified Polaromonas]OYY37437.1 MAG: MarR family transcriptional regulator [Polaromonas sp. 35-63-35]OYZ21541.1 MAG: MarR family transcriptional regulator [Polaromonas sp. 16-63-31]OYZ77682.1 MAG: MarR family transcriptional regulator [Polaromonas sp. 24-63-21]OZA49989.1 MAG: MarR family transcriptional regulator [Polaromonas sp. 17-63-33]OZA87019.1 MAG: MarR family transcriptional regulator [Polaromonas sp. 39
MPHKSPGIPRLDEFLTYRLHLVNKLTDKFSSDAYADEFNLPVGEARCLAAIGNFAPLSVVELAAKANLNKGQASRAAQSLVERGLVSKEASTSDGRGVVLTLTRAGQRLWSRVMALIARRNEEIFGCLSATQQHQLGRMLDRLIAHARA